MFLIANYLESDKKFTLLGLGVVAAFILDYEPDFYEYSGVILVVMGMLVAFFNPLRSK